MTIMIKNFNNVACFSPYLLLYSKDPDPYPDHRIKLGLGVRVRDELSVKLLFHVNFLIMRQHLMILSLGQAPPRFINRHGQKHELLFGNNT